MNKHQKHAKIAKMTIGNFGRNELSFVGTSCGAIKSLCAALIEKHSNKYKICYVDADHAEANNMPVDLKSAVFTDKITYKRIDFQEINSFQQRFLLNEQDLVLVNGNHFEAQKQFVFIDAKKEASLQKRLSQLTNIQAFILTEGQTDIFDFLKGNIKNWENIPQIAQSEIDKLSDLLIKNTQAAPLKGLVLAGGQSTRMGTDKGLLNYHGKSQREFVFELLNEVCTETFISCRENQIDEIAFPGITDKFVGLGVYGAILSAFQHDPNAAWLVVACDMPLLDASALAQLKTERNLAKIATAFYNSETQFPDPLLTIYEPKAYQTLLNFLALGYSCPRKVLINSDIQIIMPQNQLILSNANTADEAEKIKEHIKKTSSKN